MTRDEAIQRLRAVEPVLRAKGVTEAWLFGSTARDATTDQSDVDVAVVFADPESVTLFTLASIYADLTDAVGCKVDVVMREEIAARPAFEAAFRRDAVRLL
jgi:hypothetical protein